MFLLVYGTLRKGEFNALALRGAPHLGTYRVPGFKMFTGGFFPYVVRARKDFTIVGDLYAVEPDHMLVTDLIEGYPQHYDRTMVNVDGRSAWIYFYRSPDHGDHHILTGNWFDYLGPRMGRRP